MKPIPNGGVEIYAPIKNKKETTLENGETLYEVTIDNGSKDGIKVEYREQKGKNDNGNFLPPVIFYDENSKELSLRNLDRITVFGSEVDDNIKSTCTNSIFKFKQGGSDSIEQYNTPKHGNKIYIDSNDEYRESIIYKSENDFKDDEDFEYTDELPFKKINKYHGSDDNNPTLNIYADGYDFR